MSDRVADAVIEILALSEAEKDAYILDLEADKATYRELAIAALDAVHELTMKNKRLTEENIRLHDERRAAREDSLLRAGAHDPEAAS